MSTKRAKPPTTGTNSGAYHTAAANSAGSSTTFRVDGYPSDQIPRVGLFEEGVLQAGAFRGQRGVVTGAQRQRQAQVSQVVQRRTQPAEEGETRQQCQIEMSFLCRSASRNAPTKASIRRVATSVATGLSVAQVGPKMAKKAAMGAQRVHGEQAKTKPMPSLEGLTFVGEQT